MFTPKPKNRKRRRTKPRAHTTLPSSPAAYPVPDDSIESLREKEHELHVQIGALEDVLASLTEREMRQEQLRKENVLPPPDYPISWESSQHNRHTSTPYNHSSDYPPQRRSRKNNSKAGGLQFVILLLIALALGFWLFYTGG